MGKLNSLIVRSTITPGRYMDGDGLMLDVKASGSKSWVVRLQSNGKRRDYGLGSIKDVSLSDARELARDYRRKVRLGIDPIKARQAASAVPTFAEAAATVHEEHKRSWRNSKHQAQWLSTLENYAFPFIGRLPVHEVSTGMVRDLLAEVWIAKPETARRVRQRVGAVLDYAHGKGWREPFVMSAVNRALPRQPRKTGRFEAMPYSEVPNFFTRLGERESMGRLALKLLILTAARSGEVRLARWSEIDLDTHTWTIPAERMKAGKKHVVPLSAAAVVLLKQAAELRTAGTELIFPGLKRGKPLSDMTLLKILKDLGVEATVHGFRSSFRDWCAEETPFAGEIAEAALAHAIPNKVEAAYRRTTFFEKRREMMEAWASFCLSAA